VTEENPVRRKARSAVRACGDAAPGCASSSAAVLGLIRSDVARYVHMLDRDAVAPVVGGRAAAALRAFAMYPGLHATVVYRIGHAVVRWRPSTAAGRALRLLARLAHFAVARVVESLHGVRIAERARIGAGLYIGHCGGVIIGPVSLGRNCNVSHGVTLGYSASVRRPGLPEIGDRVWIGPGAVVVGAITVGDDAAIGANAVVNRSVPARASAIGNPAELHPGRGSFDMLTYPGDDRDGQRLRSRAQLGERSPRSAATAG
jgi:serine O-acetyltransferase